MVNIISTLSLRQHKGVHVLSHFGKILYTGLRLPLIRYILRIQPSVTNIISSDWKKWLGKKGFGSDNEIIAQTYSYFEKLDRSYYFQRLKNL